MQRLHRRLHDRLEGLLEVEGLRHGLRDARERLELGDPPLRALVQPGVLDGLRDLQGDRDEELDLGVGERPRLARADVERALELVGTGHDRNREDRLVLVLREVRELLETRVEVRLGRDHHRRPLGGCDARDALARTHPRSPRQLLDPRAVRRPQDELVRALVVQVDEARVRPERVRDLARDELEHLLQVERRVDRRDGLGQEPEMACRRVHGAHCPRIVLVSLDDWILALHVLSAFAFVAGLILFWVLIVAVRKTDTPDGTIRMEPIVKVGNAATGIGAGGTLVFGIWLAFSYGGYDIWDPWIIIALVLWAVAGAIGQRTAVEYTAGMTKAKELEAAGQTGASAGPARGQPDAARALAAHGGQRRPAAHPHRHDLEARRMSWLAVIRPDDWNLPLFLHVLGAMILVGATPDRRVASRHGAGRRALAPAGLLDAPLRRLAELRPHVGGRALDLLA